ncbi:MAG TPA: AraC family transcriptional regulator [Puia sp.]|uniref:helix-turn-helix transcriptional regulator n=1 Tax=Puia sp. TaxID=2045100 RepID=UPI002C15C6AF|nr:AraC family transcriptional regulator [Puia sp.]HVU94703.1 AraC family transcriptional regulator [Puia sp.]
MGYKMQLDPEAVVMENDFFSPQLLETTTVIKSDAVSMELHDVSLSHFHLIRGKQSARVDSRFSISFYSSFYLTHFALSKTSITEQRTPRTHTVNTYSSCRRNKDRSETFAAPAGNEYKFFDLAVQPAFLDRVIDDDEPYSDAVYNSLYKEEYGTSPTRPLLPAMFQCISDIGGSTFNGPLQQLYLETKAAELFLLQIQALKNYPPPITKLNPGDIERLHEARMYIEKNYHTPYTIIDLARIVGINQTKLKSGFKDLFGCTVFGYVKDLQMGKARQLLLDEKLFVSEVADRVGYSCPQHFAAAFKRKFGMLPSELRS